MKSEIKQWWQSKTIQIAMIQAIIGIVVAFTSQYPEMGGLLMVKSVLDIILRTLTTEPVKL